MADVIIGPPATKVTIGFLLGSDHHLCEGEGEGD